MNIEAYKDMLSAEEIAALEADDEMAADEAVAALEGEDETPPETVDLDAGAEDAGAEDAGAEDEVQDETPAAPEAQQPAQAPEPKKPDPLPDVAQIDTQLGEIDAARKKAFDEYEDGDLTREEYLSKLAELDMQADPLKVQRAQAAQMIDADQEAWTSDVRGYLDAQPGLMADQRVLTAFDRAVRYVTGNPDNAGLTNRQALEKAHRLLVVQSEGSDLNVPPVNAKAAKTSKRAAPQADPDEQLGKPAPTLQRLPQSDLARGQGDSPMAALQHMIDTNADPLKIEEAFARLTQEQRDAFSSADIDL